MRDKYYLRYANHYSQNRAAINAIVRAGTAASSDDLARRFNALCDGNAYLNSLVRDVYAETALKALGFATAEDVEKKSTCVRVALRALGLNQAPAAACLVGVKRAAYNAARNVQL